MISLLKLKRQNANAGKKGKLSTCTVHYSYSYKYFLKYPDIVHRAGVHESMKAPSSETFDNDKITKI